LIAQQQVAVEEFDADFNVNVRAPYFLVADLAPRMAQRGGAIVNISTMVANYGQAGMSLYGSSKASIQLLTKAWAAEFGPDGGTDQRRKSRSHPNRRHRIHARSAQPNGLSSAIPASRHPDGRCERNCLPRFTSCSPDPRSDPARRRRPHRYMTTPRALSNNQWIRKVLRYNATRINW
jgi:NAD(P)-dependent dehydrogenase (short-subunit alcohol dehydrogenase family)